MNKDIPNIDDCTDPNLWAEYWIGGNSLSDLGQMHNAPPETVRGWMIASNIPRRSRKTGVRMPRSRKKLSEASSGANNPRYGKTGEENPMYGKTGKKHWNWKGGQAKSSEGRILLFRPNHPSSRVSGYVLRSRLVAEKHLNRPLTDFEIVHHMHGQKSRDLWKYLFVFQNQSEHIRYEHFLRRDEKKSPVAKTEDR